MRSVCISDIDTVNERNGEVGKGQYEGIQYVSLARNKINVHATWDKGQNHVQKLVVSPTSHIVTDKGKRSFDKDHEI